MGVYCEVCQRVVPGDITAFQKHLLKREHVAPYSCCEGDCAGRLFVDSKSLVRHLREKHSSALHPDLQEEEIHDMEGPSFMGGSAEDVDMENNAEANNNPGLDDTHDSVTPEEHADQEEEEGVTGDHYNDFNKMVENSIAVMILNLRKKGNITGTAITEMLSETSVVLKTVVNYIRKSVVSHLESVNVEKDIVEYTSALFQLAADPCARLKTKDQQMTYFKENFHLVLPEPAFMGTFRYDQRLEPGQSVSSETQVAKTYQYVSLTSTLTAVLNNPIFFKMIHEEKCSTDGKIRSYLDGSLAQSNELIQKYPHTIRIVKFADELEVVNALGSKTIIHQIMGLYYLIQNLPPEENSRLRSIHVGAYGYTADFDVAIGIDSMLEKFYNELKELETEEGKLIQVNGYPYVLRATLIAVSADSKAAHEIMGLLSPSAGAFCRACTVTRSQFHNDILAMGEERTNDLHFDNVCEVESQGDRARKRTGVKRDCLLRQSCRFPQVPRMAVFDGMHDILRGVASMEIKLALRQFVVVEKILPIDLLNARLKSFQYGIVDSGNAPSPNFTVDSLRNLEGYNLLQTAAQTWCLLRVFPFIVTPEVPADHEHLRLVVLLKRATETIFSLGVSMNDLDQLDERLVEHHKLFFKLYPPTGQVPIVQQEEEEEEKEEGEREYEEDEEDVDDVEPVVVEPVVAGEDKQGTTDTSKKAKKKRKKPKIVRPINKHHHLLHYAKMMRLLGCAILYWCMRFEGKHAIAKRYAQICNNFMHLDLSLAHVHQMSHCAEMLAATTPVRDEVHFSRGTMLTVSQCEHSAPLQKLGLEMDTVVKTVTSAALGGFQYRCGLLVAVPYNQVDNLPVFASILEVLQHHEEIILVVEDWKTLHYDESFGAYGLQKNIVDSNVHAYFAKTLPPQRSMSPWKRYDNDSIFYVSPRSSLADTLLSATEEV